MPQETKTSSPSAPPGVLIDLTKLEAEPVTRTRLFGFANGVDIGDVTEATDILSTIGTDSSERSILHDELAKGDSGISVPAEKVVFGALRAMSMLHHPVFSGRVQASERQLMENTPALFEQQGYAEKAPTLREQVLDNSRNEPFTYNRLKMHMDPIYGEGEQDIEVEGLREMWSFLKTYVDDADDNTTRGSKHLAKMARSMLDSMTFIGQPEFDTSTAGIAAYWKEHLSDPSNVLCVLTNISNSEKYPGTKKSDEFIAQAIFNHFTEEEMEAFGERIVTNIDQLESTDPTRTKVVILDDWALSGTQVSRVINQLWDDPRFDDYRESLEVNFLVATQGKLDDGLTNQVNPLVPNIPIRAYYLANKADYAKYNAHISGLHCTTNYDFGIPLWKMAKGFSVGDSDLPPKLARIERPYRRPSIKEAIL